MATIAPQTAAFKALIEEMYGCPSTAPDAVPSLPLTDRQLFRETVACVSQKAKAAMDPALHARIDKAQALVLAGDVTLRADGSAQVASQTRGDVTHLQVNGTCPCRGFATAPQGWCTHRLASAIARRVQQALHLADVRLAHDQAAPTPPVEGLTPETDLLTPYVVHIHGKPFVQYAGLLALAHARGLTHLQARFVSVTAELAIAEATATFADGRVFGESSDSTPENVGAKIRPHFARMALTRAKSACE